MGPGLSAYRRTTSPASSVEVFSSADASGNFGIIEVHCGDRVALLHQIAQGLFELGYDIRLAKVETRGSQVIDTFYVRDSGIETLPYPPRLRDAARTLEAKLSKSLFG
jgi:UTP:GlnB (protein PII) uridylyltransferase